jgi:hypothetical protein
MSNKKWSLRALAGAALGVALAAALPAHAANHAGWRAVHAGSAIGGSGPSLVAPDLVVSLAGLTSYDAQGEAINTTLSVSAAASTPVDLISWNISLSTIGESWLSEAGVLITNADGDGVFFNPGFGDDFSGTGTYTGSASLLDAGISFSVGADGKLYFEFYEDFDDNPGAADATYTAGGITFGGIGVAAVPEPGTYGLMALGMLAVVGAARRRKAD